MTKGPDFQSPAYLAEIISQRKQENKREIKKIFLEILVDTFLKPMVK